MCVSYYHSRSSTICVLCTLVKAVILMSCQIIQHFVHDLSYPIVCPPLTAPDNGDIDCSLGGDGEANPGDVCTFTCDHRHAQGGSTNRTCQDDGSWSGTDTTCKRSMYFLLYSTSAASLEYIIFEISGAIHYR